MNQVSRELTNRDFALLVWLGIALIGVVAYRPTRESVSRLLKLLVFSKLGLGLLALLAYEAIVVFIFYKSHLWHWWMLKDALFWLFGAAFILFLNTAKAAEEKHYFRKVALDSFKFAVVLTFIVNLYVFNLVTELILVPVTTFLAMVGAVAATKAESKQVGEFINWVMVTLGLLFIVYAVVGISTDFHGFATLKNLEDFLTPTVLTLTFLPFAYLLALYSEYESLFFQVDRRLDTEKQLTKYAKRQIISVCRFRLSRVSTFKKEFVHKLGPSDSQADIAQVVREFRARLAAPSQEQAQHTSS